MKKMLMIAVFVLATVAAPALAKGPKQAPPNHKCQPHAVSYVVSGTLNSGSLTLNADGSFSGSITVHVTKTNKHAKADRRMDKAYTLTNAKVKLHGMTVASLTVNSRVHLEGKITTLAKKCDHTGFVATVTVAHADLRAPKH